MLRSEPRLTPEVEDDLDRLDAALHAFVADPDAARRSADPDGPRITDAGGSDGAGGPSAPGTSDADELDAELLALVADVRAARPELDVGAKMRLEERVQAAKEAPQRRTIVGRMPADRRWRLGLAAAAVVAVAIPVGVVVKGDDGSGRPTVDAMAQSTSAGGSSAGAASESATTAGSAASAAPSTTSGSSAGETGRQSADSTELRSSSGDGIDSGAVASPSPRALSTTDEAPSDGVSRLSREIAPSPTTKQAPLDAPRRVIKDVEQTVRINPGDVATSAERVMTIVQDAGGYLGSSEVRERGSRAGGTFQVVVPTRRLDSTVAALSKIGRPVRLERSSTDVTDQATSLADQLADLRSDRAAARLALAKTVDPAKRAARRRELTLLSSRVASLQGQVDQLRRQTATSRIDLRLTTTKAAEDEAVPAVDDGRWGIGDAWHDAGRVLEVGGGVVLIGGVIVLPLIALGGLGLALRRRGEARRRQTVIDEA
ncbi:DUF4349 domain-containing protein [Patulibacter minatonensis]|uniref:DUF4349 domain-containing protein n=1 Tax=Patulibacter minatonensis TaxID=298163 RepID=UPI000478CBF2|nr:DUF4349 domain-containing protein [Patulibacter minatonensis]